MKLNRKIEAILVIALFLLALFGLLFTFHKKGSSETHITITTAPNNQKNPAIFGDIVVWEDWTNGNDNISQDVNIYGHNLFTSEEFLIATDSFIQENPAIYGNIVVWEDHRNDNIDIYGYDFSTSEMFQITIDESDQRNPAIYGDFVVWTDERNGNRDIYGYNLSTEGEFQITRDESDQRNPAIYGNIVVWTDERNGNRDIYGCNLETKEEFQITTDLSDQWSPAIYEDFVVWTDERNGNYDIHAYILSTNQEFPITLNAHCQENPAIYEDTVVWVDERNGNRDIYGVNRYIKEEFQITRDLNDQWSPAIYGDLVVWTDERNDNCDISGRKLSKYKEFKIIVNPGYQENPAIYEDTVVWVDERKGNQDIYGVNLSTEEEFQITTEEEFQITTDTGDQKDPAIYRDIVVWTDWRKGNQDIYGYNLSTKEEFQITTDPHNQEDPAIYGDIVVWADERHGNPDIYGYNLSTKEEFQITTDTEDQKDPAIYGDIVMWTDGRNGDRDIYGYNLSTKEEFQITTDPSDQWSPAIYGDIVVWRDDRNGNRDIYGYNLSTKEEFQITTDPRNQWSPAIYGDIVVWRDERHGITDIYGYIIFTKEEFQITRDPSHQVDPAIYGDVIVWIDERNGNKDIYGYNILISPDEDLDGYSLEDDCHDNNPSIHPEAEEMCWDSEDNNCNGQKNEGCILEYFLAGVLLVSGILLIFLSPLTISKSRFFLSKFEPIYPNPYVAGNPIRSRDIFFGREDVFEFIKNKLSVERKNISIVLHGERRTGKTSILYQIENGELGEKFVPIYIDLQEMARVNEREFFAKITEKIIESLVKFGIIDFTSNEYSDISKAIEQYETELNPYLVLDNSLDKVSNVLREKYLILMFDEYEILEKKIKSNNLSSDLVQYLRSQMQSRERFSFIFTGSRKLEDLEGKHWSLMFNVATYKRISFLEKKDALDLMKIPVDNRIHYDGEAIDKILRLTACHPYFLQLFLQNLIDHMNDIEKNWTTIVEINSVLDYVLNNPPPHMVYIWQDSTDDQKMILSALSEIIEYEKEYVPIESIEERLITGGLTLDADSTKKIFNELRQKEILDCSEDGRYNFKIDLLRYWIKTEHPLFRTLEEIK